MSRWGLWGLMLLLLTGCMPARVNWYSAGSRIEMGQLADRLSEAKVVFVGEFHDRARHHDLQLEVIKRLAARGVPLVIGLEMFDMESQPALDRWSQGELDLEDFTRVYRQNWTVTWAQYDRILLHARNQRLPLIGLNAPFDLVSRVSRYGWSSLRHEELARLPAGVTPVISESYRDFLVSAFVDHRMNPEQLEHFCAAQGLRNNSMALLIRQALIQYPGSTVVVLTGVGHAMRRGVAEALGGDLTDRLKIVVPYEENLFAQISERDVDYVVTE